MKKILLMSTLCATYLLASCDTSIFNCEHDISIEKISPDGNYKAALDKVSCGATTSDVTWVLLTRKNKKFNPKHDQIAVFEGNLSSMKWIDNKKILVSGDAELFKSTEKFGVSIHSE